MRTVIKKLTFTGPSTFTHPDRIPWNRLKIPVLGPSCEACADGYYRIAGLYLGLCKKCDCNGHSTQCNKHTGACIGCSGARTGKTCDKCRTGYTQTPTKDCVRKPKIECKTDQVKDICKETPLDVVFLIDGSDSIIEEDFSKVKEWIIQMISELGVEKLENDLLLTIAQFSSSVETELMEKTNSKNKLTDQIRNIKQMAMGTNLYSGLSHVSKDILPK